MKFFSDIASTNLLIERFFKIQSFSIFWGFLLWIGALQAAQVWHDGFEGDTTGWTMDGSPGIWEIGVPTSGPGSAFAGSKVAATRLAGNYPNGVSTRLISPQFTVPQAIDNPRLRYWYWYDMAFSAHFGNLQVRIAGGAWQDLMERVDDRSGGGAWSQRLVDLKPYAGLNIEIGFQFTATSSTVAAGWYLDEIAVETGPAVFDSPQDFESGFGDWSVENGLWQWGIPTDIDGPMAHSGSKVVGTILSGNYPNGADARLVSPEFLVPEASENPRFKYWYWYHTAFDSHFGQLQIRTSGGEWQNVQDERIRDRSGDGGWVQRILDLKSLAGLRVQIGFRFVSTSSTVSKGWYVDDVSLETGPIEFLTPQNFEDSFGNWSVENGVWQWGEPTAPNGPAAHSGTKVVGTILSGNYPNGADARLVSPEFLVPPAIENPRFKYWYWYQTAFTAHFCQLQIRTSGGAWQDIDGERLHLTGGDWAHRILDLRPYSGLNVQIGFRLVTTSSTVAAGWYVDDVSLETGPYEFNEVPGFEGGFGDWSAQGGVWQVGVPTAEGGPTPLSGEQVAGTILAGNYPNSVDARLVSPEFVVPAAGEFPRFRFWQWHDTAFTSHFGQVQIRTSGGAWQDLPAERVNLQSLGWSQRIVDLKLFAGQSVQVGFRFVATTSTTRLGWYIEDAGLETGPMVLPNPDGFENGFGDWSSEGGMWQIGTPTAENGPEPFSGDGVAGTILAGNYFNNGEARLVSPEFVVPVLAANPELSFRHWIDTPFTAHNGRVQISVGGGAWSDISPVYSGTETDWDQVAIPLTNYSGQRVRLAFRFVASTSTTRAGWYIDDFEIVSDTLDPIPDQVISEVEPFNLPLVVRGSGLEFALDGNHPLGAEVGPISPTFSWVPTEAQGPGVFENITIWVTQPNNWLTPVDRSSFGIVVNEVNVPPVLDLIGDQVVNEGNNLSVNVTSTDVDEPANALTYSLTDDAPPGMSIDSTTGVISWTPTEQQGPLDYQVSVRVSDTNPDAINETQLSDTTTFNVRVNEVNMPPILTVPANQTIDELSSIVVSASAADGDIPANGLLFSLVNPPAGMTINPDNGTITWAPSEAQGPTTASIEVRLTDSSPEAINATQLSVSQTFSITVREINQAPVVTPPDNQTIDEGQSLSVSASAADADLPSNTLTFSLVNSPEGMTIDPVSGQISWTPTEAQGPMNATITVEVTDNNPDANSTQQLKDSRTFSVSVREVNQAPVLTLPPAQTLDELTLLNVTAQAVDEDLPINPLTFSLVNPPSGMTIHPTSGLITWVPTEAQGPVNSTITVQVTDSNSSAESNQQLSVTQTFNVTVREVNLPPIFQDLAGATLHFGTAFTRLAVATDPDLPANVLLYRLIEAPQGLSIEPTTGEITWTPTEAQVGAHTVTIEVLDNGTPVQSVRVSFDLMVVGQGSSLTIRLVGGLIRLDISGDVGQRYELEATTDFQTWNSLLQFRLNSSPQPYVDVESETLPIRHYRLKLITE